MSGIRWVNKNKVICPGCGVVVRLTNKEDHALACQKIEDQQLLRMASLFSNLGTETSVRLVERS